MPRPLSNRVVLHARSARSGRPSGVLARVALAAASTLAAAVVGVGSTASADEPLLCCIASQESVVGAAAMCVLDESAVVLGDGVLVGPPLPSTVAQVAPAVPPALLAEAHPALADRFELARVEALLARWRTDEALARDPAECTLEAALASPSSAVAAHARVAQVRCQLLSDAPHASENLEALLRRYPELPDADALRIDEAHALARAGHHEQAAAALRAIDLVHPYTTAGRLAREGLAALATEGHPAAPLSAREEVERAARLVRSGPPELARAELARLRELGSEAAGEGASALPAMLEAEVYVLSARLARVEGRFDDADAFTTRARELDPRLAAAPAETLARPASDEVARALRAGGLGALVDDGATDAQRTRALRRASSARLLDALRTTARAGMAALTDALVAEATRRTTFACAARFEIGVVASGTASDEALVALADRCVDDAASGLRVRYLRARALERLGRVEDAVRDYRAVRASDHTDTGFYALWAGQRLALLVPDATPEVPSSPEVASSPDVAPDASPPLDVEAALAALEASHGAAYPWLGRARELVALGDREAARQELHELYLAWLDARGRGPIRAGVEAVYRGATRPRSVVPATLRRQRRDLAGADASRLGEVAAALGDVGLAIRFGGSTRLSDRPRAFEQLVLDAAARHALDPDLLLAVMRVESVYDPEIVSYAGAIGLLQIMPRTGRLIAHQLGLSDFRTDDLLDPATNIELAAWYLRSLLDRFEGRLPLAIAAYNGGPHNVRRWMEEHGPNLPLDAFLERIPFDQTFRYVRRVLSHYAAYRAQEGLPLPELDTTLPPRAADVVAF